jgi:hypothetical protein
MKAVVLAVAAATLLVALGATVWVVARGAPPSGDSANDMVDSWLAAMSESSGDRGWSFLSTEAQSTIYQGDRQSYWDDLEQVDWGQVTWAPASGYVDDGVFYSGAVWLRSHPSTLPRFTPPIEISGKLWSTKVRVSPSRRTTARGGPAAARMTELAGATRSLRNSGGPSAGSLLRKRSHPLKGRRLRTQL